MEKAEEMTENRNWKKSISRMSDMKNNLRLFERIDINEILFPEKKNYLSFDINKEKTN